MLLDSLTQATNAKNLFLNQLLETKVQLAHPKSNGKIPLFSSSLTAADGDRIAMTALDNLSYMKDAFGFQIATLFELGEFDALNYTIYEFNEYCKCIEPPVRRNEPLNARNRASYCEQESRPTIFTYRTNLLYNEVACLRA